MFTAFDYYYTKNRPNANKNRRWTLNLKLSQCNSVFIKRMNDGQHQQVTMKESKRERGKIKFVIDSVLTNIS